MATETLAPDALLSQTNLTGAVTDIDDDPDSPDSNWLTASGNNVNTECWVSFPKPSYVLTDGAGLQTFNVAVRQYDEGQSGTPDVRLELWENGVLDTAGSDTPVGTGTSVVSLSFNSTTLTGDGGEVELKIFGIKTGGSPSKRNTVEIGAVEWVVTHNEFPSNTLLPDAIIYTDGNWTGSITAFEDYTDYIDQIDYESDESVYPGKQIFRVSFPTPPGVLDTSTDAQNMKLIANRTEVTSTSAWCGIIVKVYESGSLVEQIFNSSGQLDFSMDKNWTADTLSSSDGSGVELYIETQSSSDNNARLDIAAIQWTYALSAGPILGVTLNGA